MQSGWSYIKDASDFINKIKSLNNKPSNSILVTADVVGYYPIIPLESSFNAVKEAIGDREKKSLLRIYLKCLSLY